MLFLYNKELDKWNNNPGNIIMPIFGIGCFVFAGYSLYRYIKNAPKISLDKDFISFNSQSFPLSDITKIDLTGKRPFKYVINFPMEAARLTFNNGETKYIFDDMYSNSGEIKLFLKQVVIDKKNYFEPTGNVIDISSLDSEYFETYQGAVITSLRGISLWGFVGFFTYKLLSNSKSIATEFVLFISFILIFWFLMHTYLMNYFQVSNSFLVVRNHNFFWTKKVYRITDIKEIVFETQGKMPNCLRVITKSFKNKLYPAGTLRDRTWLELKDKFESYNIKVRNECI